MLLYKYTLYIHVLNVFYVYMYMLMRDERRKEERSKHGQTNSKVKQTNKAVTFPRKNELPRVGLEPMTLYTLDSSVLPTVLPRQLSWLGPNLTSHSTPDEHVHVVCLTLLA